MNKNKQNENQDISNEEVIEMAASFGNSEEFKKTRSKIKKIAEANNRFYPPDPKDPLDEAEA